MAGAISRRDLLRLGAGLGALMAARPRLSFAGASGPDPFGVPRASRLFPGRFVVHSDLHNHSAFSGDAVGDPEKAFRLMLEAGLDVAALTDHAIMGKDHGDVTCSSGPCRLFVGLTDAGWARTAQLADAANADGAFTAMRGFEWTTGTLGHVNVWFTRAWTDPLHTRSLVTQRALGEFFSFLPVVGPPLREATDPVIEETPEVLASMDGLYDWLLAPPDRPMLGGGLDGIAGFNHPNLYGNFGGFAYDPRVADRMVTCEALNGFDDYLFYRPKQGQPEPINAILQAGWRVGMIGVSDEHGTSYGVTGKARGGLLVSELTRAGVREALEARRTFATREPGLRLDAAANGVQMGGDLPHDRGPVRFVLDVDRAGWTGRPLKVQVLRPGQAEVTIAATRDMVVPPAGDPLPSFEIDVDAVEGSWVLLRITDPERPPDAHLPGPIAALGGAVAYTSPWFLAPPQA